jgi:peptidoglycan/LPS O-acetylase OafA/YrhL
MRRNNFDIVRLTLALVVVLFHLPAVSQSDSLGVLERFCSGELAVQGFFAISGFLIFASWERATSLRDYCIKRAARILPGYWLATALCVAIAFWYRSFHVGSFLLANLTFLNFLHPQIDGVFDEAPYTPIMNGALWTIKIELMFYALVPVIVWITRRLRQRDLVLWTVFAASVAIHIFMPPRSKWQVELPGQLCYFMVGALIHYHLQLFYRRGWWIMAAAAAFYGLHLWTGWFVFRPLAIPALVLGAALLLPVFRGPTRWGDFSYGTYVLHWPIIQCIVATGMFQIHPWAAASITVSLVEAGAVFSWFFVEKPSLSRAHAHTTRVKPPVPAIISS